MKTPKIVVVTFAFSGGYSVITRFPFDKWHVYNNDKCIATYEISGRADVTKHRALRILKKALDIRPRKGSRLREIYDRVNGS